LCSLAPHASQVRPDCTVVLAKVKEYGLLGERSGVASEAHNRHEYARSS